jgi:hypothetical protein
VGEENVKLEKKKKKVKDAKAHNTESSKLYQICLHSRIFHIDIPLVTTIIFVLMGYP